MRIFFQFPLASVCVRMSDTMRWTCSRVKWRHRTCSDCLTYYMMPPSINSFIISTCRPLPVVSYIAVSYCGGQFGRWWPINVREINFIKFISEQPNDGTGPSLSIQDALAFSHSFFSKTMRLIQWNNYRSLLFRFIETYAASVREGMKTSATDSSFRQLAHMTMSNYFIYSPNYRTYFSNQT